MACYGVVLHFEDYVKDVLHISLDQVNKKQMVGGIIMKLYSDVVVNSRMRIMHTLEDLNHSPYSFLNHFLHGYGCKFLKLQGLTAYANTNGQMFIGEDLLPLKNFVRYGDINQETIAEIHKKLKLYNLTQFQPDLWIGEMYRLVNQTKTKLS